MYVDLLDHNLIADHAPVPEAVQLKVILHPHPDTPERKDRMSDNERQSWVGSRGI